MVTKAVDPARLGDYLRDRDLGFVITEWDTTDDRAEASLLADGPRELLLVGQALSWQGLDRGKLRHRAAVGAAWLPHLR